MRIGIIGGGQLARFLILAAYELGYDCAAYVTQHSPAVEGIVPIYQGSYNNNSQLTEFLESVDVVTYESESIPVSFLERIANDVNVLPGVIALSKLQDRLNEKNTFLSLGIPTNRFIEVSQSSDLKYAADNLGFPFVLKVRKNGYDGKGQYVITDKENLAAFENLETSHFIAEEWINYTREISIVGVRDQQGNFSFYDVCQNYHRDGILQSTQIITNDSCFEAAKEHLTSLMNALDYVGVMALEFFDQEGSLLANEAAPRVHNSGHWTLKGAYTSQFENHIRAICGLPLGSTKSIDQCALYNIIGENVESNSILAVNGAYYYYYKKEAKPNRKLGHVILIDTNESKNPKEQIEKIIN